MSLQKARKLQRELSEMKASVDDDDPDAPIIQIVDVQPGPDRDDPHTGRRIIARHEFDAARQTWTTETTNEPYDDERTEL